MKSKKRKEKSRMRENVKVTERQRERKRKRRRQRQIKERKENDKSLYWNLLSLCPPQRLIKTSQHSSAIDAVNDAVNFVRRLIGVSSESSQHECCRLPCYPSIISMQHAQLLKVVCGCVSESVLPPLPLPLPSLRPHHSRSPSLSSPTFSPRPLLCLPHHIRIIRLPSPSASILLFLLFFCSSPSLPNSV